MPKYKKCMEDQVLSAGSDIGESQAKHLSVLLVLTKVNGILRCLRTYHIHVLHEQLPQLEGLCGSFQFQFVGQSRGTHQLHLDHLHILQQAAHGYKC
jgi:hypothetical protein